MTNARGPALTPAEAMITGFVLISPKADAPCLKKIRISRGKYSSAANTGYELL